MWMIKSSYRGEWFVRDIDEDGVKWTTLQSQARVFESFPQAMWMSKHYDILQAYIGVLRVRVAGRCPRCGRC